MVTSCVVVVGRMDILQVEGNIFMMVISRWWAYMVGMVVVVQSGEIYVDLSDYIVELS